MATKPFIIAIDGPAASGKGTVARAIAEHCGFAYLDTGKLYRCVAYKVLQQDGDVHDVEMCTDTALSLSVDDLENPELRSAEVSRAASIVAAHPAVRRALFDFQRGFAANPKDAAGEKKGAVLDGRDIGSVICPDADIKFYVTAKSEDRAERRHKDLLGQGETITLKEVLADIAERDRRDCNRTDAPLIQAEDAHLLNTSDLDIEQSLRFALAIIDQANDRI